MIYHVSNLQSVIVIRRVYDQNSGVSHKVYYTLSARNYKTLNELQGKLEEMAGEKLNIE